jgi:hypothetical protein
MQLLFEALFYRVRLMKYEEKIQNGCRRTQRVISTVDQLCQQQNLKLQLSLLISVATGLRLQKVKVKVSNR